MIRLYLYRKMFGVDSIKEYVRARDWIRAQEWGDAIKFGDDEDGRFAFWLEFYSEDDAAIFKLRYL